MDKATVDELQKLAAHINKIERRLKEAEQIREEVVIAAINELRYAGRRFVDAWSLSAIEKPTPEQTKEMADHFVIARQYLINADHDITDAICLYVHGEINRLQKRYGTRDIISVMPDYIAFATRMDSANTIVSGSREDRSKRNIEYDRLEVEYVPALLAVHKDLLNAERLVLAREKRKKFWAGAWKVAAGLGTAGTFYFSDSFPKIVAFAQSVL